VVIDGIDLSVKSTTLLISLLKGGVIQGCIVFRVSIASPLPQRQVSEPLSLLLNFQPQGVDALKNILVRLPEWSATSRLLVTILSSLAKTFGVITLLIESP